MANFKYEGFDRSGARVSGSIESDSIVDAREQLKSHGYMLKSIQEEKLETTAQDLLDLEGMDRDLAVKLADAKIFSRDDLADLGVDELVEMAGIDAERASDLIMKARAHWFASESAESGGTADGR